ncbi:MAG: sulfatase activating formylglycine-generating enzyme [Planctomycetota bacterium]|jgi:formylglycine-generating enzyme required for sulfatase activity
MHNTSLLSALILTCLTGLVFQADSSAKQDTASRYPDPPKGPRPVLGIKDAAATQAADMLPYLDRILGSKVRFRMQPIPGGRFHMGSPADEAKRKADEGPRHEVEIAPFWMGVHEVTWDEYELFMLRGDKQGVPVGEAKVSPQEAWADAVSRPTPPYVPMDFDMGIDGFPAISMTQFAAKQYTKWLSMKTGRFYRLATEAEWEYACRAGSTTAYSFGADAAQLGAHAWYFENSKDGYHPVGTKKPNAWGLHDMHGNVAEWVLDGYGAETYGKRAASEVLDKLGDKLGIKDPVHWPTTEYPRVVRGGSWDDDPHALRAATRRGSQDSWKMMDPQLPKSIWYLTNAKTVGFRIVRPLISPSLELQAKYWEADLPRIAKIQERQRKGAR